MLVGDTSRTVADAICMGHPLSRDAIIIGYEGQPVPFKNNLKLLGQFNLFSHFSPRKIVREGASRSLSRLPLLPKQDCLSGCCFGRRRGDRQSRSTLGAARGKPNTRAGLISTFRHLFRPGRLARRSEARATPYFGNVLKCSRQKKFCSFCSFLSFSVFLYLVKEREPFSRKLKWKYLSIVKRTNMGDSSSSDDDEDDQTFYPTKGHYIVNAITGVQTNFKIGSNYERQFRKVVDVSLTAYDPSTGSGRTYFFPSPEMYETAKNVKISKDEKLSWKNRRNGGKCACLSVHVCYPSSKLPVSRK